MDLPNNNPHHNSTENISINSQLTHLHNLTKNLSSNSSTTNLKNSTKNLLDTSSMTYLTSIFTLSQYEGLYRSFLLNTYPSKTVIREFAIKFDKSTKQIRTWFRKQREKAKRKCCDGESNSRAHASTNSKLDESKSHDSTIFSTDCQVISQVKPKSLIFTAHQLAELEFYLLTAESNSTGFNPQMIKHLANKFGKTYDQIKKWFYRETVKQRKHTKSVNSAPIVPNDLTRQSLDLCPQCQSFCTIIDQHFPDNSITPSIDIANQLMHLSWSVTDPLMDNWPDTSDLYRRMDHNLVRFVNDLI